MNILRYKEFFQKKKAELNILLSQKEKLEKLLLELNEEFKDISEAQDVMNLVGVLGQSEFSEIIECLVTQSLQHVFGPDYSFQIVNQIVRNQSETQFYVVINGLQYSLEEELGGGVLDVVSFALRVVFWLISVEKTEPIMFFDEPLKYISADRLDSVGKMLKGVSELLGLQIIMVSHENYLINISDHSFQVTNNNGISYVEKLK